MINVLIINLIVLLCLKNLHTLLYVASSDYVSHLITFAIRICNKHSNIQQFYVFNN